jgi:hypothetical protein
VRLRGRLHRKHRSLGIAKVEPAGDPVEHFVYALLASRVDWQVANASHKLFEANEPGLQGVTGEVPVTVAAGGTFARTRSWSSRQ